ncbi:MAG TPA: 2'-5' RNA ligase family protein, partial [Lacibacter sp.]|nr:2'-5' RNA ligase family protein [Lacibacter sp.]
MQTKELNNIHRMYYVAVVCPPEIDEKVLQYKHWMRHRFGCKAALKSPAHLTLIAPFWLEEELEQTLKETTKQFHTELLPFEIRLNNFDHFSNRVLFVHTEANE